MSKILENNSGMNNKSCSTFHQESMKIGFAFSDFFYNFLWILQESAKHIYYLRFTFATRPLTVLDSLRVGPCFALKTLERTGKMQLGPRGRPAAVLAKIRRAGGAGGRGKGREVTMNSPRVGLRPEMGRGWHWRALSAALGGGGHGGARSGEVAALWRR
jgi:hypothetical protein